MDATVCVAESHASIVSDEVKELLQTAACDVCDGTKGYWLRSTAFDSELVGMCELVRL